eukprot:GEMP01059489.1.p1 GENE.GEMP01059489.1~~GEMP01059489.1.p1  ORF type:complete len:188 (+),score=11.57 GEMP01059489.1:83-646(+)
MLVVTFLASFVAARVGKTMRGDSDLADMKEKSVKLVYNTEDTSIGGDLACKHDSCFANNCRPVPEEHRASECKLRRWNGSMQCFCEWTEDRTTSDEKCTTPCGQDGYDYFWCYTTRSWDYCSLKDLTRYGVACDGKCGKHGISYDWCWTNDRWPWHWDYCSPQPSTVDYTDVGIQSFCSCKPASPTP